MSRKEKIDKEFVRVNEELKQVTDEIKPVKEELNQALLTGEKAVIKEVRDRFNKLCVKKDQLKADWYALSAEAKELTNAPPSA